MNTPQPGPSSNERPQRPAGAPGQGGARPPRGNNRPGGKPAAANPNGDKGAEQPRPRRRFGSSRPSHPPRAKRVRVEHATHSDAHRKTNNAPIPPVPENVVRIIPLGGVEEIGRNMTAVEYGGDIFIVDCGFAFSEDETPGIDYILPNTGYLEERRDKIRGIFVCFILHLL